MSGKSQIYTNQVMNLSNTGKQSTRTNILSSKLSTFEEIGYILFYILLALTIGKMAYIKKNRLYQLTKHFYTHFLNEAVHSSNYFVHI